jgi:hypothetical protein
MQPPVENLPNIFYLLILSLLIGLTEETIFRGYVQKELKNHYKPIIAILLTSVLFAALHMPRMIFDIGLFGLAGMISFTMIGLIIGLYRRYLESLSGVIILHAFWDYWLLIFLPLEQINIDPESIESLIEALPLLIFLLVGIALAYGFLITGLLISWKFIDHSETDFKEIKSILESKVEKNREKISDLKETIPMEKHHENIRLILEEKLLDTYNELLNELSIENVKIIKKTYRLKNKIKNLTIQYYTCNPILKPVFQNKIRVIQDMLPWKKDEELFNY